VETFIGATQTDNTQLQSYLTGKHARLSILRSTLESQLIWTGLLLKCRAHFYAKSEETFKNLMIIKVEKVNKQEFVNSMQIPVLCKLETIVMFVSF
jgi:hypothetical protein